MSQRVTNDAIHIRKLIREAEAVTDEALIACSRLKQSILVARQNPAIGVDVAQKAIMRLTQAEQQALSVSTSLLRVHDELNRVAREVAGPDEDHNTNMSPSGIAGMDGVAVTQELTRAA
jgi:hypothetical protein